MDIIKLVRPSKEYEMQILDYKNEYIQSGDQFHGTAGLDKFHDIDEWLSRIEKNSKEETVREGWVPSSTFLAIRDCDNKMIGMIGMIGMIDVRHRLTESLLQFSGHIGFSVRKSERRKGYAKAMLNEALGVCKELNIPRVLVTCDKENIASAKTILSNGGILENEVVEGDHLTQRYWITLQASLTFSELYEKAKAIVNPRRLSESAEAGSVGAAILSESGKVYSGVCIDTASSMGFCAEHAAVAAMITAGENRILKVIAVGSSGNIMPPCGRCREFISQMHDDNLMTEVMVSEGVIVKIKDLLPFDWRI